MTLVAQGLTFSVRGDELASGFDRFNSGSKRVITHFVGRKGSISDIEFCRKETRQRTYNVTLNRAHVTITALEKQ